MQFVEYIFYKYISLTSDLPTPAAGTSDYIVTSCMGEEELTPECFHSQQRISHV